MMTNHPTPGVPGTNIINTHMDACDNFRLISMGYYFQKEKQKKMNLSPKKRRRHFTFFVVVVVVCFLLF